MIKKKDIVFNYSIFIATLLILMLAILSTKRAVKGRVLIAENCNGIDPKPSSFRWQSNSKKSLALLAPETFCIV